MINTSTTSNNNDNGSQAATIPKKTVNVISIMSAFPFVQRWAAQYNDDDRALAKVQVSFSDEVNVKRARGNDLAIVGNVSTNDNISYVPVSAQAVAIVYNIPSFPDVPSGLNLDANLSSLIFNGTITEWDDKSIKNLNQNLNLPHKKIIIIHEGVNSSSSDLLRKYILPDIIMWPDNGSAITASGSDELASLVRKTPYSIGYVDFSYAIQTKMTFAAIANPHSGRYIIPSIDSIGQAVNTAVQIQNASNTNNQTTSFPPFINSSRLGNSSYPIVGLYYAALVAPGNNSSADRNATLDFVKWVTDRSGGQQVLSEVQYPPIYNYDGSLATYTQAIITKIFGIKMYSF